MASDQAFCATSIPTLLSALQEDNGERDELLIDIKVTEAARELPSSTAELCELVQVALALASNMSFKRLHLDKGCPDKLAFVIIQALQHNSVLKSFHLSAWGHTNFAKCNLAMNGRHTGALVVASERMSLKCNCQI